MRRSEVGKMMVVRRRHGGGGWRAKHGFIKAVAQWGIECEIGRAHV